MSGHRDGRTGPRPRTLAFGVVAALLALAAVYRAGSARVDPAGPGAALVIYRDPVTGQLGVPPADIEADLTASAVRRPTRMVVRPGTTAGGGTLLDGIPLMRMTASADRAGDVSTHCEEGKP